MKAQEKPVKRRHPPVIFASLVQNVMKTLRMSGNVLFYSFKENNDNNSFLFTLSIISEKKTFSAVFFLWFFF